MGYFTKYKNQKHNWGQHTLGDYFPGLDDINRRNIDKITEGLYQLKKRRHEELKFQKGKKLTPLRRGRRPMKYPTKSVYDMSNPRDVSEIKKFPWFTPCWHQKRKETPSQIESTQLILDDIIPNLYYSLQIKEIMKNSDETSYKSDNIPVLPKLKRQRLPRFHSFPFLEKNQHCKSMTNWAWCARSPGFETAAQLCHIFYLNSFDFFDDPQYMEQIGWSTQRNCLPSDIIRIELFKMLQGFDTITSFFGILQMSHEPLNFIGVNMINQLPDAKHYSSRLKQIGIQRVKDYFQYLVSESRKLGLIKDIVHTWDGQFYETWIKKQKPRKENLEQFFGGIYNHGGKNVGIGVYMSPIMDWNGLAELPLILEAVPANENENKAVKRLINKAYDKQKIPRPRFFLADRGPSGRPVQYSLIKKGITPIIPLTSNVKYDVRITKDKKHRFYKTCLSAYSDVELERIYNIRTRHEEGFSLYDIVFRMKRLHYAGKEMTELIMYMACCLSHLIAQTAYKIGRPDLMWSPAKFRDGKISPSQIFPAQYQQLLKIRDDPSEYMSLREIQRLQREGRFDEIKNGIN